MVRRFVSVEACKLEETEENMILNFIIMNKEFYQSVIISYTSSVCSSFPSISSKPKIL